MTQAPNLQQEQRLKSWHFFTYLYNRLRSLLQSMEGDVRALREQGFDRKMLEILIQFRQGLLHISHQFDPERPDLAAKKFAEYMDSHRSIADNLDFLIQHHLQSSTIEPVGGHKLLGKLRVDSIRQMQDLAQQAKDFIAHNPSLTLTISEPPPPPEEEVFTAPANPAAKKRL